MYELNRTRSLFLWKEMGIIKELSKKIRRSALKSGYACDGCGKELFDYPTHHRLCDGCEEKLLSPKRPCPKCGRERIAEGLCMDCKYSPPKFTQGISPFVYRGECASLINRMKNGYPRLAAYFGERMAKCFLERAKERNLLIVAVPMTKSRERERGYNQAERLAESMETYFIEKGFSVELNFALLEKTRETKLQKRASVRERAENVQGAFRLRKRKSFEGRTVILVDDIMTTGATGNECAQKILKAGASAVYFVTATAVPENK